MHASEALKMELFFKKEVKKKTETCFLYFQTVQARKGGIIMAELGPSLWLRQ